MGLVSGCASLDEVRQIASALERQGKGELVYRDAFLLGYELMLRYSDLARLRYSDVQGDVLSIKQQKTGKRVHVKITTGARAIIEQRRQMHPDHEYLIQLDSKRSKGKAVSRSKLYEEIRYAGQKYGLTLGTHSARKTKPTIAHAAGTDLALLSKALGHSSPASTLHYLGVTQRQVEQLSEALSIALFKEQSC